MFGMFLSTIKDIFTAGERKRELEALRIKLENHDERLSKHEDRLSNHDELHNQHIKQQNDLRSEIKWNAPFVYTPFDPISP